MTNTVRQKIGLLGEDSAEKYLKSKGYSICGRNFRIKNLGEIDIIGKKEGNIRFFEVKTRNVAHETSFPTWSSIDFRKKRNLKRICELYLINNKLDDVNWQIDGIFVYLDEYDKVSRIEHIENMVWEEYY